MKFIRQFSSRCSLNNTMIINSICIIVLLGSSIVAQSLQERLARALDPLRRSGGTVLAARLMLLNNRRVRLSGKVIGRTVNVSTLKENGDYRKVNSYEQFIDDTDLNFNIKLDGPSKKNLEKLLGIKLTDEQAEVECESVAFARAFTLRGKPELPVFPGWRDEKWNVTFNGKPFWTNWDDVTTRWESLRTNEPNISVLGVLVIDCGDDCKGNEYGTGVTKDCGLNNKSKIELHPVYDIRIIK